MREIFNTTNNNDIVVAGHACIDMIPNLAGIESLTYRPGVLSEIGAVTFATGGCVPNVALALRRLGAVPRIVARAGDDALGRFMRNTLLADGDPHARISLVKGEHTSYSLILSPRGQDRMVLHFPGANDHFYPDEVPDEILNGARLFHFGYPTLMRSMYRDGGRNLRTILQRAKSAGLTTCLDLAYPDPAADAGAAPWRSILEQALPFVDLFVPSFDEFVMMLDPPLNGHQPARLATLQSDLPGTLRRLGQKVLSLGTAAVLIKLGEHGVYLRTASESRVLAANPCMGSDWADRELWSPTFEASLAGTNGAGDATVAGLLFALSHGSGPAEACQIACATGAASVEAQDAVSGIPSAETLVVRISNGWRRRRLPEELGFRPGEAGVYAGADDRRFDECGNASQEDSIGR